MISQTLPRYGQVGKNQQELELYALAPCGKMIDPNTMKNEPDPFVKNPRRAVRNWFVGLLLLGLLAMPIVYFSEVRDDPEWSPIAFASLGVAIAISYALFLSYITVGCSLLFDRRRPGPMKVFYGVLGGIPLLLNVSLLLFIKFSTPDTVIEHVGGLAQICLWTALALLLALVCAACLGWWKHLKK